MKICELVTFLDGLYVGKPKTDVLVNEKIPTLIHTLLLAFTYSVTKDKTENDVFYKYNSADNCYGFYLKKKNNDEPYNAVKIINVIVSYKNGFVEGFAVDNCVGSIVELEALIERREKSLELWITNNVEALIDLEKEI